MIKNINKPTSAFWGKVQATALTIGAIIEGYAHLHDVIWLQYTALAFMVIGGIVPIFMPNKEQQ